MALSRSAQNRLILGAFFAFLIGIGVENQCHMAGQVEAYRNDGYVQRLREALRREFLAQRHGVSGALDVRSENRGIRLGEIMARLEQPPPERLRVVPGAVGTGRLEGLGHPFLGGKPEPTVWLLVPGCPGGSLDFEAIPERAGAWREKGAITACPENDEGP